VNFEGTRQISGPNYKAERGTFKVFKLGRHIATLSPEKREYPVERGQTTEASIKTMFTGDLYIVLGERSSASGKFSTNWSTRIYFNPLVVWIWGGAILMAFGGLISLTDRRYRIGAPTAARPFKDAPEGR
jgi:Cytochrome c biogenesis factor